MNKIYRLVWNRTLGVVQVATEFAKASRGGVGASRSVGVTPPHSRLAQACAAALLLGVGATALPAMAASTYTVTQASDNGNTATVGTLSWAIAQANSDPGSTIQFDFTGATTITESGALPSLDVATVFSMQADVTIQAPLSGAGSLSASGTGSLALAGDGTTLTGGAVVHAGSLTLGDGTGSVNVTNSGTGATGIAVADTAALQVMGSSTGSGGSGAAGSDADYYTKGAYGGAGGVGGIGVMAGQSSVDNAGTVSGGTGGVGGTAYAAGAGGAGGAGIQGAGSTVDNRGSIAGGVGGNGGKSYTANHNGDGAGGAGGDGVGGSGLTFTNHGSVAGGAGGYGGTAGYTVGNYGGHGGTGGAGAQLDQSSIANDGGIVGGVGGTGGFTGHGGDAGNGGDGLAGAGFTLDNTGRVEGGAGGYSSSRSYYAGDAGSGGAGVSGSGFSVGNTGTITGGIGGAGVHAFATPGASGSGGAGVIGSDFTLDNAGVIAGGAGGGYCTGDCYAAGSGGGEVPGIGPSFSEASGVAGSSGGSGVSGSGFQMTNAGTVQGGNGGNGGNAGYTRYYGSGSGSAGDGANGGAGGAGIVGTGMTLTNTGTVQGGNGGNGGDGYTGYTAGTGGAGGAGVVSTGNSTIINAGLIAGGVVGADGTLAEPTAPSGPPVGPSSAGVVTAAAVVSTQADAVDFSGGGNTLELRAGYRFVGNVLSTSGTTNGGDTLALGGDTDGSFDLSQIVMAIPTTYNGSPRYHGFATYTKSGSGMWTLTGRSTATTDWTVSAGKLEVGDAAHPDTVLTGDVTVTGGTLGGHGTITGTVSNMSGTVMPGGSVGILALAGDYVQGPNGTLSLEITPDPTPGTGSSQLQVGGAASLDGTLAIMVDPGSYLANTSYDLVHAAGGVSGTFATTTFNPGFAVYLTPQVSYGANDVTLKLSPNAAAYAGGYPNYASTVSLGMEQTFDAVLGRMGPTAQGRQGAWGQMMAGLGGLGQGSRYQLNGAAAGYGHAITDRFVLGVALSGGTTTTTVDAMQVRAKPFGGFVYGIWRSGGWRVSGSLGTGKLKQHSKRYLASLGGMQTATGGGHYAGAALRVDYTVRKGIWSFTPYAGMDNVNARYDATQEQGITLLALHYGKVSQHLSHYQAGLRIGAEWGHWQPWVQAGTEGWRGDRAITVTERLGDYRKDVTSSALPGSALSGGAGVTWKAGRWDATLSWHGAVGSHYHGNRGMLQARYSW
ncbi:ESPR-type extended signal peptide-containing protein [Oleiagrimonas sp. MCCC 1A03011]|uniref:ESPR-type extended signal peptide-containing protein n=1 Tax=Oleiagrimonas sp. MCCC 1A03011 TaxID=1926883 RepID=UPI000DC342FC|nr:ESPR-type extended signal peptide-containing protein [Oleiagrimonas sp. MCCC 1A03011]RAP59437.1 hypothetical protein BTJ49_01890 [Oleiagrimonas sp. MCCC 1A03011]